MEYIKRLNTFSGDEYVTRMAYGVHLMSALSKIRAAQLKKMKATVKNVDEMKKVLDEIAVKNLEPKYAERIKKIVDYLVKIEGKVTASKIYQKMADITDSSLKPEKQKKKDVKQEPVVEPKTQEPIKQEQPTETPVKQPEPEKPKKEIKKYTLKKKTSEEKIANNTQYLLVVDYAKNNPNVTPLDLQIKFRISIKDSERYIKKLKDDKILDTRNNVVKKHELDVNVKKTIEKTTKTIEKDSKPKEEKKPTEKVKKIVEPKPKKVIEPKKPVEKPKLNIKNSEKSVENKPNVYLDQQEYEDIVDVVKSYKKITYELLQRDFNITRAKAVEYAKQLQKDKIINGDLKVLVTVNDDDIKLSNVKTKEDYRAEEYEKVKQYVNSISITSVADLQKHFGIGSSKAIEYMKKLQKDKIIDTEGNNILLKSKIKHVDAEQTRTSFEQTDKILNKLDNIINKEQENDDEEEKTSGYQSDDIKKLNKNELRKRLLNRK